MRLLDKPTDAGAYVFVLWGSKSSCKTFDELMVALLSLMDTRPSYDVVVLLSEAWLALKWPLAVLRGAGALVGAVRNVDSVRCRGEYRAGKKYLASSFTIFSIWSLTQYRVVLYMDADIQVMLKIDHLFKRMLNDPTVRQMGKEGRSCYMNTGVWMVRPAMDIFERLMRMALHTGVPTFPCDIGFQSGVNAFFLASRRVGGACNDWFMNLAATYNCNDRTMTSCLPDKATLSAQNNTHGGGHVVHWSGWPKPDQSPMWDAARGTPRSYIDYVEVPPYPSHDVHAPMHPLQAEAIASWHRNLRRAVRSREQHSRSCSDAPLAHNGTSRRRLAQVIPGGTEVRRGRA